jgi:chromosome segregation ATPase
MQGARWGWLAFIAAIGILFAASSHDHSSNTKVSTLLRQELKAVVHDRDEARTSHQEAVEQLALIDSYARSLDLEAQRLSQELKAMKAERDKYRREVTALSQDRNQLQQTVASLQVERSQTKRSIDQLRQGLNQLLSQTESVAQALAAPAAGFAQIGFDEAPVTTVKLEKQACSPVGTYYPDEPLNNNK